MALNYNVSSTHRNTEQYRQFLMENLDLLKQSPTEIVLGPENTQRHEGDFYGVLANLDNPVDRSLWYIVSILNGIEDSSLYDGSAMTLKIPNSDIVVKLDNQFLTG